MIEHLGFTGTKAGMTPAQAISVIKLLDQLKPKVGHHGDCIGADELFHYLCLLVKAERHVHPPTEVKYRAGCKGEHNSRPAPYLDRDQEIVDIAERLIATPVGVAEKLRSGTWATVRRARTKGIPIYIVLPSGDILRENYS